VKWGGKLENGGGTRNVVPLHETVKVLTRHALRSPHVLRLLQREACQPGVRELPCGWAGATKGRPAPAASSPAPRPVSVHATDPGHLIAQRGTESCHDPGRIILAAIEAAINDSLEASSQRLQEGRNHQRRADDAQGLLGQAAGHGTHQGSQGEDETNIQRHQQDGQAAIDQGAVDDDIDVPRRG
jgi:hypothetical protein